MKNSVYMYSYQSVGGFGSCAWFYRTNGRDRHYYMSNASRDRLIRLTNKLLFNNEYDSIVVGPQGWLIDLSGYKTKTE